MKIILKAEGDEKATQLTISNDNLDNPNFVELDIDGLDWTVSIEDLFLAAFAFEQLRKNQ
jgi:hypothetical protein